MLKCSLGKLIFPMDFSIAVLWTLCCDYSQELFFLFFFYFYRFKWYYTLHVYIPAIKKSEFVRHRYFWQVYLISHDNVVRSVLHCSPDGWRLLKGKVYENERQIIHTNTHLHTHIHLAPPLLPPSVSGGHLFRKAKKGFSEYFTLEIKWVFKWWPLARGHICSVTNFTPSLSPGGSPAWPHPGNLWPPFAWTKTAEGRVFRLTEIICLHKRCEGLITGFKEGFSSAVIPHSSVIVMARSPRAITACTTSGADENRLALSPDGKCFDNELWFTAAFGRRPRCCGFSPSVMACPSQVIYAVERCASSKNIYTWTQSTKIISVDL